MDTAAPKTVLVLSDFHTAHIGGLNPPQFHHPVDHPAGCGPVQRELFNAYQNTLQEAHNLSPTGEIDVTIHLGDFIDGKAERTGGTECLIPDLTMAGQAAGELVLMSGAKHYVLIHGTPAHDGRDNDYANLVYTEVANSVGPEHVELHSMRYVRVNEVLFHCKHFVSSSVLAHTKYTGLARSFVTLEEWGREANWPLPDVILRGHVHHAHDCGDTEMHCYVCPCWQVKSKYGARQIDPGPLTLGAMLFIIPPEGKGYQHYWLKVQMQTMTPEVTQL